MVLDEKYLISGMSCAACSARVDKSVRTLNGVKEVNVNLLTNTMVVSYDEKILSTNDICLAISNAGYEAELLKIDAVSPTIDKRHLEDHETPKLIKRFIVSFILLVPLFYLSMGYMLNWPTGIFNEKLYILAIIELILSTLIIAINHKFFISGFKGIIHLSMNMDTLVMLGSGVAFIYSLIISIILFIDTANGADINHLHMLMMNISFETAGMVPTLITIGKTLESYSKGKTTNAIKALMDLSSKTATIIKEDKEIVVPIEEVQIDDIFIVKQGMSIPVDGQVIQGNSSVDESMLTGESIPVEKNIASFVKSGTINLNGTIICKALRVGENTTLNQIIKSIEAVSNSKAKISKIADKVSAIFVPTIIGIAVLTFLGWFLFGGSFIAGHTDIHSSLLSYAIERAISVLVISCPCALGLATPVAIMVGSGHASKKGILFKNAEAIEEGGKIQYLILDKTGTITKGKPEVTQIISYMNEEELLKIAYTLEKSSSHPYAEAIVNYAKKQHVTGLEISDFISYPGKGIKAKINDIYYYAGNQKYMKEMHHDLSPYIEVINGLAKEGKTPLIFANNAQILGIIVVSDLLKEESKEAISYIKDLGIIPIMLTGDNELTAKYIAKEAGIDYVISDVLPEEKLMVIELFKKYGKVMMVGDGINDAIALTSADIGLAIGGGSDIAKESADVVLMKSSLLDAYAAIRLSKHTYLNIKENLFWAFIYNVIMIPIAAGIFSFLGLYKLAPWMGASAMALSSVFVVVNALRINFFNPYKHIKKTKKVDMTPLEIIKKKTEVLQMNKVIKIEGMMCMHCVKHVEEALKKIEGVTSVSVSLEKGEAVITANQEVKDEIIEAAIDNAGYKIVR